jgi:hypothetical protein
MLRNWRVRAMWQAGLAGLFAAGTTACWWWQASVVWWGLSIIGVISALIGLAADINACHTTKVRLQNVDSTAV